MNAPGPAAYEVNATYLAANVRAIRELGFFDRWRAALPADLKTIAEQTGSKTWWPGVINERLLRVLADSCGEPAVEAVGFTSVQKSIGPIVMPLLKVTLAITGSDPHTIYSRIGQFSSVSSRGVDIKWRRIDETHGETVINYPARVDPAIKPLWRGGLRCGFTLLNREGVVDSSSISIDGKTLSFLLSWK